MPSSRPLIATLVLLSAVGAACGDSGSAEVAQLAATVDGDAIAFSWEEGPMHSLTVYHCTADCNGCGDDGLLDYGTSAVIWLAASQPIGDPELVSPVQFGSSLAAGATSPVPLVSGDTYGVEIWLADTCTKDGCGAITYEGCAEFIAP